MTNILTAMAQAYADSIPMLVISSVNERARLAHGNGYLHELPNQRNLVGNVCAFSHTLMSAEELPAVLARAFAVFDSERPRPVHIELPLDVITAPAEHLALRPRTVASRPAPALAPLREAAARLRNAKKPLLLLGGGCVEAAAEARALAAALDAPTALTINARACCRPTTRCCWAATSPACRYASWPPRPTWCWPSAPSWAKPTTTWCSTAASPSMAS